MDHVPVFGGYDRHGGDGEIFVDLVECGCGASAACADDAGSRLVAEDFAFAVECTVHEGGEGTGKCSIMYRTTEYESIGFRGLVEEFVHSIIHEAAQGGRFAVRTLLQALCAAQTAGQRLHTYPEYLGLDAGIDEFLFHFLECCVCTSLLVRASVYKYYFHDLRNVLCVNDLMIYG